MFKCYCNTGTFKHLNNRTFQHKLKKILTITLFLFGFTTFVNGQYLSDKAQISVLTYSPVSTIHTVFGHSSIRVYDPINRLDLVYNYGMFDYNAPNFLLNFVRGKMLYSLGVQDFRQVVEYSKYRNQELYEQVLNLDAREKQDIYLYLQNNLKPENRNYYYDFFYDNCATRIRDILDETTNISYDTAAVYKDVTFRDLLQEYTPSKPWMEFGIDLILGLPVDKTAAFEHQMFLPDYLNKSLAVATIATDSTDKKVVKETRPLNLVSDTGLTHTTLFTPIIVFGFIFFVTLLINFVLRKERLRNIWNGILLFATGISGIIFLAVWLGTEHVPTYYNLNLLWALPINIYAAIQIWRKRKMKTYFAVITILNLLILLTFPLFPQELASPVFFILLSLIMIGYKEFR